MFLQYPSDWTPRDWMLYWDDWEKLENEMLDDGAKLERTKCWPYPAKCQEVGTLCTEMNPRNENKAPQWSIPIEVKCAECHKMTDIKDARWQYWSKCSLLRQRGRCASVTVGTWNKCPACVPPRLQRFFCPPREVDGRLVCCSEAFCDREDGVCRKALIHQIDTEGWTFLQRCYFCGKQCEGNRIEHDIFYRVMEFQTCAECKPDDLHNQSYNRLTCRGGCGFPTRFFTRMTYHEFPREFAPVCDDHTGLLTHYDMKNDALTRSPDYYEKTDERHKWNRSHWCLWPEMHHMRNLWSYGRCATAGDVYDSHDNRYCQDCIIFSRTQRNSTPPDHRGVKIRRTLGDGEEGQ